MISMSILSEVYRGNSIGRALMHANLKGVILRGTVLDVGGGARRDYLDYLDIAKADSILVVDIETTPSVDIAGSVVSIPLKSECIDTVLCFNLLEHVFDHQMALHELFRVLKPGAVLYGWVPFMIRVHGSPDDYWRYTPDSLRVLLSDAGFLTNTVTSNGGVFLAVADLLGGYLQFKSRRLLRIIGRVMRVGGAALALFATWLSFRIRKEGIGGESPLGIWFVAKR